MATNERFDELISGWLAETAQPQLPDRVLAATFERTRQTRQHVGWRAILRRFHLTRPVLAFGAVVVVIVAVLAFDVWSHQPAVGGPAPSDDPRSPFLGTWVSTSDADGGTQTMTVSTAAGSAVEIVVTDDIASVCSGTPSTMTGTGRLDGGTQLVIPAPVYACDDGSEAVALSGQPLQEQLRDLTFVHDAQGEILRDSGGGVWLRQVQATPAPRPTTPPSAAEVDQLLNGFLDARVAGEGAQPYLSVSEADIPLLYSTTSGARYERAEFEPVLGIEWPYGDLAFKVRLFAGDTVVEQLVFIGPEDPLALSYERDGFGTDIAPTIENGQPVASAYDYFDGAVTLHAAHPWIMSDFGSYPFSRLIPEGPGVLPTTDGAQRHDGWDQLFLIADPVLGGTGCQAGQGPTDAEALAERIQSDPDLGATGPTTMSAGQGQALVMDVNIAAGATIAMAADDGGDLCPAAILRPVVDVDAEMAFQPGVATGKATGERMRLYLFDVPEGSFLRTLAIAIVAPDARFERAVAEAVPVVDSIEFHAPSPGSPSVSPAPSATATPSVTAGPSIAPAASGSRFDSTIHGISIDVPSGSQVRPATEPWTGGPLAYDSPAADVISFPGLGARAYVVVASQPLGQLSEDAWRDQALAWLCEGSGTSFWGVKADGYRGMAFSCPTTTSVALIPADGRGYLLRLVVSSDEAGLAGVYDGWFTEALKTVDLRPIDAMDAPLMSWPGARLQCLVGLTSVLAGWRPVALSGQPSQDACNSRRPA